MKNRPVVIGISAIQQKGSFEELDEALILMEKAAQSAISDTTNPEIIKYIKEIQIPKGYWRYRDPGKWIADRNGIISAKTSITKVGVLQQNLINSACNKIINNKIKASLIIGGEARYKKIKALIEDKEYIESELLEDPDHYVKPIDGLHIKEEEDELGLMAVGYYAILESAYRASLNLSLSSHQKRISMMYEDFSKIAASNIDGWSDEALGWKEIATPSKRNSLQSTPYNKYHCSSWNVNQASAMIICSEELADQLNIPISKRIYPLASSETNHMITAIQRPNLLKPEGLKLAANFILDLCKKNNIKPNTFELYSCFPIAVQMFADALGLDKKQIKTITGGMSFAGGPLNHFVIQSTVKMLSEIRKDNSKIGILTGVSGMMTKQSFALWAKKPIIEFISKDVTKDAKFLEKPIEISTLEEGSGTVIGYTALLDETGKKFKAVLYTEDTQNKRKVLISRDSSVIKSMGENEWVGKKVKFKGKYLVS